MSVPAKQCFKLLLINRQVKCMLMYMWNAALADVC